MEDDCLSVHRTRAVPYCSRLSSLPMLRRLVCDTPRSLPWPKVGQRRFLPVPLPSLLVRHHARWYDIYVGYTKYIRREAIAEGKIYQARLRYEGVLFSISQNSKLAEEWNRNLSCLTASRVILFIETANGTSFIRQYRMSYTVHKFVLFHEEGLV